MGVSGCGKTTIGKNLGKMLNIPFFDADDFHSYENIEKMKNGIGLNDEDRKAWLLDLSKHISTWSNTTGAVLACSALKAQYRNALQATATGVEYIYLHAEKELIKQRFKLRSSHYMPSSLIDSQFIDLEKPVDAIELDAGWSIKRIMDQLAMHYKPNSKSKNE